MTSTRELSPDQLIQWVDDRTSVMRLHTDRDVLPGGYMAALSPLLIAWPASEVSSQSATVVVRNVNYGGNPFERITVLRSLRLSMEAVEAVELLLVPIGRMGTRGPAHHVQLRFIFEEGNEPVLLDLADTHTGTDPHVPDLVLSLETWRSPKTSLDRRASLGLRDLALSLRAYTGAQRYLEDTIRGRSWQAYRLKLPGGRRGVRELLAVCLTLGDGLARNALGKLLKSGEESWMERAPAADAGEALRRWRELEAKLSRDSGLEDRMAPVPEGTPKYHGLLRSCATVTRYLIFLAVSRLVQRDEAGDFDSAQLPSEYFAQDEPWMGEAASGDLLSVFMCAPSALRFFIRNPASRPRKLPEELDSVGLLEHRDGQRVETVYGRKAVRPYGSDGIHRIPRGDRDHLP